MVAALNMSMIAIMDRAYLGSRSPYIYQLDHPSSLALSCGTSISVLRFAGFPGNRNILV